MFSTPNHIGLSFFPVCVKKQEIKQPYFEGYFQRDRPFFEVFNVKFYQSQDLILINLTIGLTRTVTVEESEKPAN